MNIKKRIAEEKSSWWYWFKKSDDGNLALCNNCNWVKERGAARSTSILRCHLKTKHPEFFLEKLQADDENANKLNSKKRKAFTMDDSTVESIQADSQVLTPTGVIEGTEAEVGQQSVWDLEEDVEVEPAIQNNIDISKVLMSMIDSFGIYGSETTPNNAAQISSTSNDNIAGTSSNLLRDSKSSVSNDEIKNQFTSQNYIQNTGCIASLGPSIVKVCRMEGFSAAHRLHNPKFGAELNEKIYGKCNSANGHGHNYTWKVVLEGPVDIHSGMVYNLSDLKQEMSAVLELVDHNNLDKDVPYFRDNEIVSTTENLAIFLYDELASRMKSPDLLKKVVVCETDKNSFSYSGPNHS